MQKLVEDVKQFGRIPKRSKGTSEQERVENILAKRFWRHWFSIPKDILQELRVLGGAPQLAALNSDAPQPAALNSGDSQPAALSGAMQTLVEDYDEDDEAKTVKLTFDLRWPSGACIRHYENEADLDVERFTQDMDEGLIDGILPVETDEDGVWREMHALLHDNVMMKCGQKFSHYRIPHNATHLAFQ